ncbi:MAG: S8 family serine peptidase [Rudaea sp.]
MRLRAFWIGACALVLASLILTPTGSAGAQAATAGSAPIQAAASPATIPNRFIVVFKNDTAAPAIDRAIQNAQNGGAVLHYRYTSALKGFAATLPAQALNALRGNRQVAYLEEDQVVTLDDAFVKPLSTPLVSTTQTGATWGLDRIDQRSLPLDGTYNYSYDGTGVNAYIIDTGIRITHTQFSGRAFSAYTAISDGNGTNDCNGHGTHVSGTVGGSTYGVAKKIRLYAVRVLNCSGSGTTSGVIAGVDWVTQHHISPAVANMSLGGGASSSLDTAVNNSINSGVVYAVAAGNSNAIACNYSPARVGAAITVGATTSSDARASYSNYGSCLDIFAPGSSITSAWNTSDTSTNTISGTSMATPHVTGVAALYRQAHPADSPATVRNAIVSNGTMGKVTNPGSGSPNILLYSLFGTTPPPPAGNIIVNPGFESGPGVGWSQHSSGGYTVIDTKGPHTGSYSASECDYNSCAEWVEQKITIPTNGTLTYWWYMTSSEGTGAAHDFMYVRLFNSSNKVVAKLRARSNLSARNQWSHDTVSLGAYAGQTLKVRFATRTNGSLKTAFYIDDVAVQ